MEAPSFAQAVLVANSRTTIGIKLFITFSSIADRLMAWCWGGNLKSHHDHVRPALLQSRPEQPISLLDIDNR
jgi:hypothetical protein